MVRDRTSESTVRWLSNWIGSPTTVTRIIVRFSGYVGRYVWHCRVLEHEDNEILRRPGLHVLVYGSV
jgi:spore coat protein A